MFISDIIVYLLLPVCKFSHLHLIFFEKGGYHSKCSRVGQIKTIHQKEGKGIKDNWDKRSL